MRGKCQRYPWHLSRFSVAFVADFAGICRATSRALHTGNGIDVLRNAEVWNMKRFGHVAGILRLGRVENKHLSFGTQFFRQRVHIEWRYKYDRSLKGT